MFNLSGSELVFLLLLALIVLGPEKLPEAVRKFGRVYSELKKMSTGFQSELKSALDEPMREMRETADAFKKAVNFEFDDEGGLVVSDDVNEPTDTPEKIQKYDFDDEGGSVVRPDPAEAHSVEPPLESADGTPAEHPPAETSGNEPPMVRPPGPTFHSAAPQPPKVVEAVEEPASE
ncbi:MAG TPA: twin-arginine translocase TatA/TatE family subunit [Ilumatobacteraceae bacterium]